MNRRGQDSADHPPARVDPGPWSVPLIGRNRQLTEALRAVGGPPAVVRVEGEAGIGKTRLLAELMGRPELRSAVVLFGTCHRLREPFPFGPMIDALTSVNAGVLFGERERANPLLGALRPLLPEFGDLLPADPPALGEPRAERFRVCRAMGELLRRRGRCVLVLDDLQWADDATLGFLRFLVDRMPVGLTVVAGYRDETDGPRAALTRPAPSARFTTITLTALTRNDVLDYARLAMGPATVSPELAAEVWRISAGVPFAVEETLRAIGGRRPTPGELLTEVGVPGGVREAVMERVDALSPAARRVVEAAAVLGRPGTEGELAVVVGADRANGTPVAGGVSTAGDATVEGGDAGGTALTGLTEALRVGMMREPEPGRYALRHALAQEAVHQSIPGPVRRRAHAVVADMLAARRPVPHLQVAVHRLRSGDHAGWRGHSDLAADHAAAVGDIGVAITLWQRLLDPQSDVDGETDAGERVRPALKLGRGAISALDTAGAERVLTRLTEDRSLPPVVRAELRCDLGLLRMQQIAEPARGYAEIERAVGDLVAERPAAAVEAMSALGMPYPGHQHVDRYLRWWAEIDRVLPRVDDPVSLARVEVNRLSAHSHVGRPDWERARRLAEPADDDRIADQRMRGCVNIADSATVLGHYPVAGEFLDHAATIRRPSHSPFMSRMIHATRALLDWSRGAWPGLRDRAVALAGQNTDLPRARADYDLIVGALSLAAGDGRVARTLLSGIDLTSGAVPARHTAVTATALLAGLDLGRGATVAALSGVERALLLVRETGMWVWATELAPVAVRVLASGERLDEADAVVADYADGIRGRDVPVAVATVEYCRGLLAERREDLAGAIGHFTAAQERYRELPRPQGVARARLGLGRCRLRAGNVDGVEDVAFAASLFDGLGAPAYADQCRRVPRRHPAVPPRRRGRPGYGERLSPRELGVSRLAAGGATNRDIAAALNLSPRTVEQHVSRVLRKLGVNNRQDLRSVLPAEES